MLLIFQLKKRTKNTVSQFFFVPLQFKICRNSKMNVKTKLNMKKTRAMLFLLLANAIVFVHAVVPHHYHNGIPFILNHHEHENCSHDFQHLDDEQFANECHLCHSQDECFGDCFFSPVYVRLSDDKQLFKMVDFDFERLPCFFMLSSDNFVFKARNDNGLPFEQKPYLSFYLIEYISQSLGLRAPPVF
jgi:hypothetical protein